MSGAGTLTTSQVLRQAAVRATLAPSVHNSQPWRIVIGDRCLEIHADQARQLRVLDPTGRQLVVSCGCAIFNVRVALAHRGWTTDVGRWPDRHEPGLVARISLIDRCTEESALGALDPAIDRRRTNRRQFSDRAVDPATVEVLQAAAEQEGAVLVALHSDEHRIAAAVLCQEADRVQNADPAYRAEIRAWTTSDSLRRDGVPAIAAPRVDGTAHDDIPIRDFDTTGAGWLPAQTRSSVTQCLLLLCMPGDDSGAWVHAGEALQRIWLLATQLGLAASPLTQVVEVATTRDRLRRELDLMLYPDVLLRIGHAPATPATRRRPLVDTVSMKRTASAPLT